LALVKEVEAVVVGGARKGGVEKFWLKKSSSKSFVVLQ